MTKLIIQAASLFFSLYGLILCIKGDMTNGVLLLILGELVDMPYRIAEKIINP